MDRSEQLTRARGFTLVELMVVIAIIAFVGAAAAMMTRSVRGDTAPAFARSALAQHHETRHAAMSLGQWTRVRLDVSGTFARLVDERLDPFTAAWVPLGGAASAPHDVEVCAVVPATILGAYLPACPAAARQSICFSPGGQVSVSADDTCPGGLPRTGATLFIRTVDAAKKYKVVVFGLTGLPRLIDSW